MEIKQLKALQAIAATGSFHRAAEHLGLTQSALSHQIRALEEEKGIRSTVGARILMTTALSDMKNVSAAFRSLCSAYLTKPIHADKLFAELANLGLLAE